MTHVSLQCRVSRHKILDTNSIYQWMIDDFFFKEKTLWKINNSAHANRKECAIGKINKIIIIK